MSQSDQVVQNATFPTVRADINDNLAALFSQSSGPSAPSTTVAFQPWVDTSTSPPTWKVRNAANTGWITVGVLDPGGFGAGGVTPIANGGTGETTASDAINALVPSQSGNNDYFLQTNGTSVLWAAAAAGMTMQVITASGTYTRPSGKTSFLVFCCGGGGGSGYADADGFASPPAESGGGGGGGTGVRLYTAAEMGSTASVTIGAGGSGGTSGSRNGGTGGTSSFNPIGSGVTVEGTGGLGSLGSLTAATRGGLGGSFSGAQFGNQGQQGTTGYDQNGNVPAQSIPGGGGLFGGKGANGVVAGASNTNDTENGNAGDSGIVIVLEF